MANLCIKYIFCAIKLTQIVFYAKIRNNCAALQRTLHGMILSNHMDQNFQKILQDLGLKDDEARVYEALLEIGQSVVSPVASLAKVNRTTCYNILESLAQKKLVSKSNYRGKISYRAENPAQIINNLENQKKQLELKIKAAKDYSDELSKRFTQKYTKPLIKYVEGFDGLKELYDDSLRCQNKKDGIMAYSSIRDLTDELGDYAHEYFKQRAKRGVPIRGIVPDTEAGKHIKRVQDTFLRTARLVPKEKFDFSPEIYLYDNKLAVFSFKERFGFLLESKEIVDALKVAWRLAWERAEEYDKDIDI